MALEQLPLQASSPPVADDQEEGTDCQAFLSQLWRQTQQIVNSPPAKPPDWPQVDPVEQEARVRFRYD